jgi:hypothetical protein
MGNFFDIERETCSKTTTVRWRTSVRKNPWRLATRRGDVGVRTLAREEDVCLYVVCLFSQRVSIQWGRWYVQTPIRVF